ncbi:unnamed protein product, partial [Fusarium equiseti]
RLKKKEKKMVEPAPGSEPVPTQEGPDETPPSKKPSAYVFDSNGDTRIILRECMAQTFLWKADKIWVEQKCPTDILHVDWVTAKFSNFSNNQSARPDFSDDGEIDPAHTDTETDQDSTGPQAQMWEYGVTRILPLEKEVEMLVSGKHLELASSIFKTMITGPFVEGKVNSAGIRQITASNWDPEAFKIILNIIHGYHRDVPRSLSLEMLAKVTMIVDYYECNECVELYIDMWLEGLGYELPKVYGRDCILCLFISWVFSKPILFGDMTQLALRHSQRLIEAQDFPIPADILEEIDVARQFSLAEIFSATYELFDRLQEEEKCSFECSSMLLGVLTKELGKRGILSPRAGPPFEGFSIQDLKEMINGLKKPRWYSTHNHRHSCCIQTELSIPLAKMESGLRVFDRRDFQTIKNRGCV